MTDGRPGRTERERLTFRRDPEANAAYLAFTEIGPGEATETIPLFDRAGNLFGAVDLDDHGCVLGIEILDERHRLPQPPGPRPPR